MPPTPPFDFDHSPPPDKESSAKWRRYEGREGIIPLWVADMDFASPQVVIEALHRRIDQATFGYALPPHSLLDTIVEAMQKRYSWKIEPSWIVWLPGLVCGLNIAAQAFAGDGQEILTLSPIYPPFLYAGKNAGRSVRPVTLELNQSNNCWEINWEKLENSVSSRTKLFLLCSPHNPIGKVWKRPELKQIAEFCRRHDLVLCSDEIHCDLILDSKSPHLPTAGLSKAVSRRTVTLMAPSKTYNIPGLGTSFAIIEDKDLRSKFIFISEGIVPHVNALGYVACEAAYRHGESWRAALLEYLRANRDFLFSYLSTEIPSIQIEAPIEATYLAWLNLSSLQITDPINYFEKHGVGLADGVIFGALPGQFARMSFGCPRSTLRQALDRLKRAVNNLPQAAAKTAVRD